MSPKNEKMKKQTRTPINQSLKNTNSSMAGITPILVKVSLEGSPTTPIAMTVGLRGAFQLTFCSPRMLPIAPIMPGWLTWKLLLMVARLDLNLKVTYTTGTKNVTYLAKIETSHLVLQNWYKSTNLRTSQLIDQNRKYMVLQGPSELLFLETHGFVYHDKENISGQVCMW